MTTACQRPDPGLAGRTDQDPGQWCLEQAVTDRQPIFTGLPLLISRPGRPPQNRGDPAAPHGWAPLFWAPSETQVKEQHTL